MYTLFEPLKMSQAYTEAFGGLNVATQFMPTANFNFSSRFFVPPALHTGLAFAAVSFNSSYTLEQLPSVLLEGQHWYDCCPKFQQYLSGSAAAYHGGAAAPNAAA